MTSLNFCNGDSRYWSVKVKLWKIAIKFEYRTNFSVLTLHDTIFMLLTFHYCMITTKFGSRKLHLCQLQTFYSNFLYSVTKILCIVYHRNSPYSIVKIRSQKYSVTDVRCILPSKIDCTYSVTIIITIHARFY